jgi:peptidoglycan/LPS O-acetylase OafA/YrhL
MNAYFPLIDVLRFLAAFAVVCFHYFSSSLIGNKDPFSLFSSYGMLGVQLFFIISGFVIFFSLNKGIKEYALGRFLRLYPMFWILCTITYIATLILPHGNPVSFVVYLYNLLIVNTGKTAYMVDGSYWTLTIEIIFYFFIALYVYIFTTKKLLYFYAGWILLTVGVFYFNLYYLLIMKILLVRQAPYFIFGGLVAYLYAHTETITRKEKILAYGSLILAACTPLYITKKLSSDISNTTNFFGVYDTTAQIFVTSFFVFFPLIVYISKYITKKKIISISKALGLITYPLYLIHQKLGSLLIGESFGRITTLSVVIAISMIAISYYIGTKEAKLRRVLYKKLTKILKISTSEKE